jgi:hypothetical protein
VTVVALHDDEWRVLKNSDVGISTAVMDSNVFEDHYHHGASFSPYPLTRSGSGKAKHRLLSYAQTPRAPIDAFSSNRSTNSLMRAFGLDETRKWISK